MHAVVQRLRFTSDESAMPQGSDRRSDRRSNRRNNRRKAERDLHVHIEPIRKGSCPSGLRYQP